ncbi:hypothetical protein A3A76_02140 [Candidatus Woesebacteria bacterium RIFCSPLOWO2_01_FULL_39_23]|uniref:R3H domain-containing protein n=1 Tax=Candidatus Woesebacteria bacterium RIFCSPHIGHO2_01_FULL_40_22 TaxID=1802499 RepID=A0A1F7YH64_9BACT|nr:MAG: hypothetical protein A2141_03290 [Candidatus Woesebacteria bacterium RBG_16_40_11]OGM26199.1 MAG: hypothetical protein A2628_02570 [Candidatus Woesebacteria bacterium RIFCSPHIGHO2_01_FULL_40_22]OGM37986.1 MAG: hypothetical protein A3E41_03650 [Candidatus Woesebacteria bacterium RIFCSPHIGHO2_12_FULL_38_9]OGM62358.1 MAG: hypothetical protein A3A76_02140 [Candidatus Woesebacteria bacterium RIFCSPLOWO2_01_FULL_39_23]
MIKTKTEESLKKECQDLAGKLLTLLGIKTKAEVTFDEANDAFSVEINAVEEAGLLIGKAGETVGALQTFLSLALRQESGEWHRVLVNVADWREKQNARLEELATLAATRAKETKEPQNLYNLTPAQRRVIHLFLSTVEGVKTESVGEGKERYLVITSNDEK